MNYFEYLIITGSSASIKSKQGPLSKAFNAAARGGIIRTYSKENIMDTSPENPWGSALKRLRNVESDSEDSPSKNKRIPKVFAAEEAKEDRVKVEPLLGVDTSAWDKPSRKFRKAVETEKGDPASDMPRVDGGSLKSVMGIPAVKYILPTRDLQA